jgi:hypothetical protein
MSGLGPLAGGNSSDLNITSSTVVSAGPATLNAVNVNAISGTVGVHDTSVLVSAGAGNLIATLSAATVNPAVFNWPCDHGITVVIHASGTLSVSYSPS